MYLDKRFSTRVSRKPKVPQKVPKSSNLRCPSSKFCVWATRLLTGYEIKSRPQLAVAPYTKPAFLKQSFSEP